jgi:hypothetical protein
MAHTQTLCVTPMERLVILFVFIFNYSFTDGIDDIVKKKTDSLKSQGVEKILIHQYSLFNGRYTISYDNKELECNNIPTVIHIFWPEGERWNCLRLDKCGLFEIIKLDNSDFDDLTVDEQIKFKKDSPHFTRYKLTKIYKDNSVTVAVSGTQLTKKKNRTIKAFNKVNKIIKQLEDNHKFKRVR